LRIAELDIRRLATGEEQDRGDNDQTKGSAVHFFFLGGCGGQMPVVSMPTCRRTAH
jgi:hypothetical protein